MYIGFLGAPSSGKTTTAARVFAELKESGLVVEFLSEQARMYIADLKSVTLGNFILDDRDQKAIMKQQAYWEEVLEYSIRDNDGILITDSCALNSLFYMKEPIKFPVDQYQRKGVLLYYTPPLPLFQREDPLRIHSKAESAVIEDKIRDFVNTNPYNLDIRHLDGSLRMRANVVIRDAFDLLAQEVADSLNETAPLNLTEKL